MQRISSTFLPLVLSLALCKVVCGEDPLGKVLDLLNELAGKITKDGEAEAKAYKDYFEWCDDASKNTGFAIQTAEKQKTKLEAKIQELSSDIVVTVSKIEELGAAISVGSTELNKATTIREKEAADFAASEGELRDAIDTLSRALDILEKEMAKNPASFAQLDAKSITGALQGLSEVFDAAAFLGKDQAKLTAFVQSQQADKADDLELGAPAAAQYKTHSTGILDVLEDMKEKAEGQLSDLRKAEVNARHNHEMVKQSLEDQRAADTKDMTEEKVGKAEAEEAKATAESELEMTTKSLTGSQEQLETAHSTCLQVAADHQATVAARKEELDALATAKKILVATTSGASSQTYSLIQLRSRSKNTVAAVVGAVQQLAKEQRSSALAQLASRISTVLRYGSSGGEDPFGKVKGLIQDMIAKLQKEAGDDATEKAYCDEQMAKTEAKKSELEEDLSRMTSRIDTAAAKSAQLKEEIQVLEGELAALAKEQAEMDRIRQETHEDYVTAKADLELGLRGVRKALAVLRDYYASGSAAAMLQDNANLGSLMRQPAVPEKHSQSSGAGGGIIDILEVVEGDFAKNLAKEETEEADAQSEYEKISQGNKITTTSKQQDVKYKTQESKALDTTAAEYSSDRETASKEFEAVLDYYSKIKDRCIAKPETYSARTARRAAEIKGLKQALTTLEDETALVQRKRHSGTFLGTSAAL